MKRIALFVAGLLLALNCFAETLNEDGTVLLSAIDAALVEAYTFKLEMENKEFQRLLDESAMVLMMMQMKIDALEKSAAKKGQCL